MFAFGFGLRLGGGSSGLPSNVLLDADGSPILDADGTMILAV